MVKPDAQYMSLALKLARKGQGRVEPNPMVGCVIVKSGKIIAEGYHKKFGGPHAEIEALKKINFKAKGATMYVTLEPCCHFGKTPPCVDAVIKSGVKRVVIGMKDPNPLTKGKSIRKLRRAGVEVTVGVCEEEARRLNREFIAKFLTPPSRQRPCAFGHKALVLEASYQEGACLPYVIVKVAQSADGKIAAKKGERTQITGRAAMNYVQKLRQSVDAILVGANTIRVDDPQLNVRDRKKKQPLRIVLSKSGKIDPKSRVFKTHGGKVFVIRHVKEIGWLNVQKLLVEGGEQIFSHFLKSNLADEWHVITAPMALGKQGVGVLCLSNCKLPTAHCQLIKKGFEVGEKRMLGKDELVIYRRK